MTVESPVIIRCRDISHGVEDLLALQSDDRHLAVPMGVERAIFNEAYRITSERQGQSGGYDLGRSPFLLTPPHGIADRTGVSSGDRSLGGNDILEASIGCTDASSEEQRQHLGLSLSSDPRANMHQQGHTFSRDGEAK